MEFFPHLAWGWGKTRRNVEVATFSLEKRKILSEQMINIHLSSSDFPLSKAASSTLRKRVCSSPMKAQDDKKTITEDGNSEQTRKPVLDFLCIFFFNEKKSPFSPERWTKWTGQEYVSKRNLFEASRIINSVLSRIKGFICVWKNRSDGVAGSVIQVQCWVADSFDVLLLLLLLLLQ